MSPLLPVNRFALKEWAAVCAALESGRQTVLLRKGGIEEGPDGFRPEHNEFWLLPTRFHQSADELTPAGAALLHEVEAAQPPAGTLRLDLYGCVTDVLRIEKESDLAALEGLHILSEETVRDRFHYRTPGLWVLAARIFRRTDPFELTESPHIAGCRSWVDLRNKLPTAGLKPVLADAEFVEAVGPLRALQ
jgi:hypothetical protein